MTFVIGAKALAQDDHTSAKFRHEKSSIPNEANIDENDVSTDRVSFQEERFDNGSVYYVDDPNPKEGMSSGSGKMKSKEIKSEKMRPESPGSKTQVIERESPADFGTVCALHNMLDNRDGEFKIKRDGKDQDLKIERKKDGEAKIKYESDAEYYKYKENEKGESEYTYGVGSGNESVEIRKNKDGSGEVFYYGEFDNLDNAKVFEQGIMLESTEGGESVCK
jgi:hypothetical protein